VLVLLIVSVGVHFALTGLGLLFFGAEGFPQPQLLGRALQHRPLTLRAGGDHLPGVSVALIVALWLFFERTLYGKALRPPRSTGWARG
jgi:branched-chain amino acid transport system permease protein